MEKRPRRVSSFYATVNDQRRNYRMVKNAYKNVFFQETGKYEYGRGSDCAIRKNTRAYAQGYNSFLFARMRLESKANLK